MNSNRRLRPSVFLHSARMMFEAMQYKDKTNEWGGPAYPPPMKFGKWKVRPSKFSCDNLADFNRNENCPDTEYHYFSAVFEKDSNRSRLLGWWRELPDGDHDYESRIIALLLCYEMSKDGVKFD